MAWNTGTDPMDAVEGALRARSWKYQRADSQIMTGCAMPAQDCAYQFIRIRNLVDRQTLSFQFTPGFGPERAMAALLAGRPPMLCIDERVGFSPQQVALACALLTNENYDIILGSYARDESDGEIQFKIALPYRDSKVTEAQAEWCIGIGTSSAMAIVRELRAALGTLSPDGASTAMPAGSVEVPAEL